MAQKIKRVALRKRKPTKSKKRTSSRARASRPTTAKRLAAKSKLRKKRAATRNKTAAKSLSRKSSPRPRRKRREKPIAPAVTEQVMERVVVDTVEEVAPGVVVVREYEFNADAGPTTVRSRDEK